jgi:hypothetical protein
VPKRATPSKKKTRKVVTKNLTDIIKNKIFLGEKIGK